jgi:hypothetical protein
MGLNKGEEVVIYCSDEAKFMSNLKDKFIKLKKALAVARLTQVKLNT